MDPARKYTTDDIKAMDPARKYTTDDIKAMDQVLKDVGDILKNMPCQTCEDRPEIDQVDMASVLDQALKGFGEEIKDIKYQHRKDHPELYQADMASIGIEPSESLSTNDEIKAMDQGFGDFLMKKGELKGKKEMVDKLSALVKQSLDASNGVANSLNGVVNSLTEHMKTQDDCILESSRIYLEAKARSEEKAKEFCLGKTVGELVRYLADQPVAYNLWKNADYDTLIKLAMDVYEEL